MEIYLRALELDDYKIINTWRNDEAISSQLSGNKYFISSERERKSIENKIFNDKTDLYLAICLLKSKEIIGFCSINNIYFIYTTFTYIIIKYFIIYI